jgi:hypothetical protein
MPRDESLNGWVRRGGKAEYHLRDGAIVGVSKADEPNTFLCTTQEYADFELTLEFKVSSQLNSGVQIRSAVRTENQRERVYGYQVEIDPSERAWTGGIYEEGARGWLNDLKQNEAARSAFVQGAWNEMRVRAVGDHIQTWINGVPSADLRDATAARGFIGLQVHDVGSRQEPLEVAWRNIRIREVDASSGG